MSSNQNNYRRGRSPSPSYHKGGRQSYPDRRHGGSDARKSSPDRRQDTRKSSPDSRQDTRKSSPDRRQGGSDHRHGGSDRNNRGRSGFSDHQQGGKYRDSDHHRQNGSDHHRQNGSDHHRQNGSDHRHGGRQSSPTRCEESTNTSRRNHTGLELCRRAANGKKCKPGTCSLYPCNQATPTKIERETKGYLPTPVRESRQVPVKPQLYTQPVVENKPNVSSPTTIPATTPTTTTVKPRRPAPPPPVMNIEGIAFKKFVEQYLPILNKGEYKELYEIDVVKTYLTANQENYEGHFYHFVEMLYGETNEPTEWFKEITHQKLFDFARIRNHILAKHLEKEDFEDIYKMAQYGLWHLFKATRENEFNLYSFNGLIMCEFASNFAINRMAFKIPTPIYQYWSNQDFASC